MESLRTQLRRETRDAHSNLDNVISHFDVASMRGLKVFLSLQRHALQKLVETEPVPECKPMMRCLLARLDEDLITTGAVRFGTGTGEPKLDGVHPMAVDYVISGSRIGTTVLRRRWEASKCVRARFVSAYFSAPSYLEYWQQFSKNAAEVPADTQNADRICADAGLIFEFYTFHATALLPVTQRMQSNA